MKIELTIPEYTGNSLRSSWEGDYKIETRLIGDEFIIAANKDGLISLAKQLLTLAQEQVPSHHHFHLDELNYSLEPGSIGLILEKM